MRSNAMRALILLWVIATCAMFFDLDEMLVALKLDNVRDYLNYGDVASNATIVYDTFDKLVYVADTVNKNFCIADNGDTYFTYSTVLGSCVPTANPDDLDYRIRGSSIRVGFDETISTDFLWDIVYVTSFFQTKPTVILIYGVRDKDSIIYPIRPDP